MPSYFFAVSDNDGIYGPDHSYEFGDFGAALEQARQTLAEMAIDGLPLDALHPLAIRVYDGQRDLLAEMRLEMQVELYKYPGER